MITNDLYLKKGTEVFKLQHVPVSIIGQMPIIVGKLFMELPELSTRIHYKAPEEDAKHQATLSVFAFEELMKKELKKGNFLLALEAYKYLKWYAFHSGNVNVSHCDDLMIKETLKRYPNFDLNEDQYKTFLQTRGERVKAPKEILDVHAIRFYMEDFFGRNHL